jgi:hypothetical protein
MMPFRRKGPNGVRRPPLDVVCGRRDGQQGRHLDELATRQLHRRIIGE